MSRKGYTRVKAKTEKQRALWSQQKFHAALMKEQKKNPSFTIIETAEDFTHKRFPEFGNPSVVTSIVKIKPFAIQIQGQIRSERAYMYADQIAAAIKDDVLFQLLKRSPC